jgi:transcriptional regulator with XRE-family HTH domain
MATRRELTTEELADTQRLKQLWKKNAPALGLTQAAASKEFGFANQSAISQYLNGRIPLNMQTASRFANLLKVPLGAISPAHASHTSSSSPLVNSLKKAFKVGDNCELIAVTNCMKPIVGNSNFLLVDRSQKKPCTGVFLVGIGEDAKTIRLTAHRGSYRVIGLVPDTEVTLPSQALDAMNILGKVSGAMMVLEDNF